MQLYNIKNSSGEPGTVDTATKSTEILGKAINDLRNISHTLNSAYIDNAGLEAAVKKDLEYICSAKEVQCSFHKSGIEYNLNSEQELLVFRIIQEATANAIKHANPTAIEINFNYLPGLFTVTITDDGSGFDAEKVTTSGLGLTNMQERAKLLNGKMIISSGEGKGSTVTLEIHPNT